MLGLDLAGSPRRRTGYAYWSGSLKVGILYDDEEILNLAVNFSLVMMDAPLSLPKGRKNLQEIGPHFRECDLLLRKHGYKFFPITLGPMRMLTERGIKLAKILKSYGIDVFETYPGAFYDTFGVKRKDKEQIVQLYKSLGFELENREYTQDELDAVACFLTGKFYLEGKTVEFSGSDGSIIIPCRP